MNEKYYDDIAKNYDQMVKDDIKNNSFPFSGHEEVEHMICSYIDEFPQKRRVEILDIGIGTASIYERLLPESFNLTGIDFSEKMLEVSKLRVPDGSFYKHDILMGLPEDIRSKKFDFIIINYLFKHFDIKTVTDLINTLKDNLAPFGKIFIGDILFLDDVHKKICLTRHKEYLSSEYHYHLYAQIVKRMKDEFQLSFMEINEYTGIVIIENYYEYALQFEECLVKYKSNTAKWKSSHPQKKRE